MGYVLRYLGSEQVAGCGDMMLTYEYYFYDLSIYHVCLSICLSLHLYIYLSAYLSIYPSIHLSIYLSIYLPVEYTGGVCADSGAA